VSFDFQRRGNAQPSVSSNPNSVGTPLLSTPLLCAQELTKSLHAVPSRIGAFVGDMIDAQAGPRSGAGPDLHARWACWTVLLA